MKYKHRYLKHYFNGINEAKILRRKETKIKSFKNKMSFNSE